MAQEPKAFLIWGGGGHGKVVADLVRACGFEVFGYVDSDATKFGRVVEPGGARVVWGEDEFIDHLQAERAVPGAQALALAVGENVRRLRLLSATARFPFPSLVHPQATVSPSARIGRGTVIFAGSVINADAGIGAGVIVNSGAVVEHDVTLDDGVHLSPRAVVTGGVRVGARSWIGAGAVVIPGVVIGSDAVVGAGAVVIRDVGDGETVVGNPARPLHR